MRLLLVLLCITATASAQFPNAGFENWTNGAPDGWTPNNLPTLYTTITKSATAYKGTGAVRGDVVAYLTVPMTPYLYAGAAAQGFAYAARPASVTGYYQFSPQGGDKFTIDVILYKGGITGTPVAAAVLQFSAAQTTYAQFTVPFVYVSNDTPDLCVAQVLITNSGALHVGSYYLLDELAFSGTASTAVTTELNAPVSFELKQNYPNPFNPSTMIAYAVPTAGRVQVKVFTTLGTEVATVVDRYEEAGAHAAVFDAKGLSSGVYFMSLRQGALNAVRPMMLVK